MRFRVQRRERLRLNRNAYSEITSAAAEAYIHISQTYMYLLSTEYIRASLIAFYICTILHIIHSTHPRRMMKNRTQFDVIHRRQLALFPLWFYDRAYLTRAVIFFFSFPPNNELFLSLAASYVRRAPHTILIFRVSYCANILFFFLLFFVLRTIERKRDTQLLDESIAGGREGGLSSWCGDCDGKYARR